MLNKAPIFVNGLQRGGTNILMNLIVTHPHVCMLADETQVVFYGRNREPIKKWIARVLSVPIVFSTGQHTFWPYRLYDRNKIPKWLYSYIDFLFFCSKIISRRNRYKDELTKYSINEITNSRLVCKNINGVVLASNIFADMYPDAIHIGLVRNGLAVCEGFMRRGWSAERIGKMYEKVSQRMILDANNMENYFLVHFEDMISDPINFINKLYTLTNLDKNLVTKIALQAKKSTNSNGIRTYKFGGNNDRETHWYPIENIESRFRKDVNDNQIARISEEDKNIFLEHAGRSMAQLGYI